MLNNRKLIVDEFCDIGHLVEHLADKTFYDFASEEIEAGAIYVIGREQFRLNLNKVRKNVDNAIFIFSNPAEGSETIKQHLTQVYKMWDLVIAKKLWIISGGKIQSDAPHLLYENFLPLVLAYDQNLNARQQTTNIYTKINKPYKFLCFNGRYRPHRSEILKKLVSILPSSLYTNLDISTGPIKYLPEKYELEKFKQNINSIEDGFVKYNLFNNSWGDILINPAPYIDTYFSLITETVFEYPYSFRTEKLWKPVAIGHPFIVAANAGYYRDLKNLGFKTFGHLIDESFDTIDNNQDRIDRIAAVVQDLCDQNLPAFLAAAEETCKYNQQHLAELAPKIQQEFPQRFINFIDERLRI